MESNKVNLVRAKLAPWVKLRFNGPRGKKGTGFLIYKRTKSGLLKKKKKEKGKIGGGAAGF